MEVRGTQGAGFEAAEDGDVIGRAELWTRPDGRRFLHVRDDATGPARHSLLREVPPRVEGELHTWVRSGAQRLREVLEQQGFAEERREDYLSLDPAGAAAWLREHPGPELDLRGVDEVGLDRLQALDEELRQDVPGCDGWQWEPDAFRAESHSAAHDDALYRVAVDGGELLGLVRVWVDRDAPRLGLVAVRRPHRGRGIARTLLRAVMDELAGRGVKQVVTEADPANTPIIRLLEAMGAEVTGTMVDMVRPASTA